MNVYNIFLGMVIFQTIYIVFQYILFRRIEFVYYFLYTILIALYITSKRTPELYFNWFLTDEDTSVIGRGVITMAYGTYFRFGRYYTNSNTLYPAFSRQLIIVENFLILVGGVDAILQLFRIVPFATFDIIFNIVHLLIIPYALGVVIYLYRKKQRLITILVFGSSILILFAGYSIVDYLFITNGKNSEAYYAAFVEIGIIGEIIFLNYGLNYKTKLEQKEKIKLEIEKKLTLINERNRISSDLHDDIGATLSSMHIFGDLATNVWDSKPQESRKMVEKISETSKDLMARMGDIIWSMKPGDEEKFTLEARVRNYANELLSPKNIVFKIEIDEKISSKITNPEVRKNILLIIKEGINNIAKYSQAKNAIIGFNQVNHEAILIISDNGIGYKKSEIKFGNGLDNMALRCKQINGFFKINTKPSAGVQLIFRFPSTIIS